MKLKPITEKPTHTPGPWYCDPSETQHDFPARQSVFGGGSLLAEVAGNGKGRSGANARLIASAPDLLAACKAALAPLKEAWAKQTEGPDLWPVYEAMLRAVELASVEPAAVDATSGR